MRDAKPAVVLVHGIWMSPLFVSYLGANLRSRGYQVHYFSYWPTQRSLGQCLADFHQFIESLSLSELHLVGHSLGGKLIWQWINQYDVAPLGRVVTLGSPHLRSIVATKLARYFWGRWLMGRADELLNLPQQEVPEGWQWGVLAGIRPLGLGRLVHWPKQPCDGSVELPETMLAGVQDRLVLAQSHFGMLISRQVVRQIDCFLQQGRFCPSA